MFRLSLFFFFNDTATPEIYTLPLHDALPISSRATVPISGQRPTSALETKQASSVPPRTRMSSQEAWLDRNSTGASPEARDRKSTRLNSSHANISYAVFCLKKKIICRLLL